MHLSAWFRLVKDAVSAWVDDYAPSMGAAISYYTVFSLAPLLVLVIAVAGVFFGAEAVRGQISAQLGALMGADTAQAVEDMVQSAAVSDSGPWASLISIVVLLVGATTVFAELQAALDRIWHVPAAKKPSGIWGLLRARVFSFGLILALAFLLMLSLAVSAGIAALGAYIGSVMPGQELLLHLLNTLLAVAITTLLFAAIFKWMPSTPVAWHDVWVGALVTAGLFELGKLLIGLYLGKSALASAFAGAGSLVVLLAWVYYAAQIFLLGAEFTKVYAHAHGSAQGRVKQTPTQLNAADAEMPATAPQDAPAPPPPEPVPPLAPQPQPAGPLPAPPPARRPLPRVAPVGLPRLPGAGELLGHAARALLPKLAVLALVVGARYAVESRLRRERRTIRRLRRS